MNNERQLLEAKNEMSRWNNDNGNGFYPSQFDNDLGNQAYFDPGRGSVEISKPHILKIDNASVAVTVNLFGSYFNRTAVNFNNVAAITVTYLLAGFTYAQLLAQSESKPMQVGLIRIEATTASQVTNPILVTESVGIGRTVTDTLVPLTSPYQLTNTVTYVQQTLKVDGNINLSYSQNATPESVKMYFYASESVSLSRAFSNRQLISEYAQPSTGPTQDFKILQTAPGAGPGVRKAGLI